MEKDLRRFTEAQSIHYELALSEIKAGLKKSHWMWYIFPQLRGLGRSPMANFYGIEDLEEAKSYLNHPILGQRLREISEELLLSSHDEPMMILGSPDHLKLKSCMTLFVQIDQGEDSIFQKVIDEFFQGQMDEFTLEIIVKQKGDQL